MLPKNFLGPCLLLLLREHPSHGYDLFERLTSLGFESDDHGRLYRGLRTLEADGLVHSYWESSATGPARRTYELTAAGCKRLDSAAAELEETYQILHVFLSRCSECETV